MVIIKDGVRACGSGGVLGNAPLVQSKSYFEVKLQQSGKLFTGLLNVSYDTFKYLRAYVFFGEFSGIWGVGLATRNSDLNAAPGGNDSESWVFCYDGVLKHNKKELQSLTKRATEGDVIVCLVLSIQYLLALISIFFFFFLL